MSGDAREDIGQPRLRIDIVEPGRLDQRVEHGRALSAAVGTAEQPCLAAKRHTAQRPLGSVVRDADPAIIEEPGEGTPAPEHRSEEHTSELQSLMRISYAV